MAVIAAATGIVGAALALTACGGDEGRGDGGTGPGVLSISVGATDGDETVDSTADETFGGEVEHRGARRRLR